MKTIQIARLQENQHTKNREIKYNESTPIVRKQILKELYLMDLLLQLLVTCSNGPY